MIVEQVERFFCLNFESAQLRPAFIVWEPVK